MARNIWAVLHQTQKWMNVKKKFQADLKSNSKLETYETTIKLLGNVGQNPATMEPFKSSIFFFFTKLLLNRVVNKENLYWMKSFYFYWRSEERV